MQSTKTMSVAETVAYQRATQKGGGGGGRVAAMKSGVHLIDPDNPREARAGAAFLGSQNTPGALPLSPG